jgi:hypothetical protein
MKPNPKEINIILNIFKGGAILILATAPFYIDTPLTDIHASSGIGTHDPSVRAGEGGSCLRPRGPL